MPALPFSQDWSKWLESGACLAGLSCKDSWQTCAVVSNTLMSPLKSWGKLTCSLCRSHSGSAMNVVFTEEEMKKFLAEATRVSQVLVFVLLLLFLFVSLDLFHLCCVFHLFVSLLCLPHSYLSLIGEEPVKLDLDSSICSLAGRPWEPVQASLLECLHGMGVAVSCCTQASISDQLILSTEGG